MGWKLPYGQVNKSDILYFIENKEGGLVKGKAIVKNIFNSEKLTKEQSIEIVEKYQDKLLLNKGLEKRFIGKRYLVLITIKGFKELEPFKIDRSDYGNMDNWLPVENIDKKQLQIIQEKFNNRSRKIIGYKTPKKMMDFELKYVA